jgi:hypothetical protein
MYEIDILVNNQWEYYWDSEDIKLIDKEVFKLTRDRPNQYMRILKDNCVLCWLDGTPHKYWFWKEKYVRGRGHNYDYINSYHEHKEILELRLKLGTNKNDI